MSEIDANIVSVLELALWMVNNEQTAVIYNHRKWVWEVDAKQNQLSISKGRGRIRVVEFSQYGTAAALNAKIVKLIEELRTAQYLDGCLSHVERYDLPELTRRLLSQMSSSTQFVSS